MSFTNYIEIQATLAVHTSGDTTAPMPEETLRTTVNAAIKELKSQAAADINKLKEEQAKEVQAEVKEIQNPKIIIKQAEQQIIEQRNNIDEIIKNLALKVITETKAAENIAEAGLGDEEVEQPH